jgi:hypothetical protein
LSAKAVVQSITATISSISAILVLIEFLAGLAENSYNGEALLMYCLVFLVSWYVLGALTDEVSESVGRILAFFGVPTFMIALLIAFVGLIA